MSKKKILNFIIVMILILTFITGCTKNENNNQNEPYVKKNSIAYTGWLKIDGAKLLNEKGEPIQLRGLSSHGIQWFPGLYSYENLKQLKESWGINVFRIAMYTDPNADGYIAHPDKSKEEVYDIVDYAIDLDMYVIVDWHILNDNNPQIYENEAKEFFYEIAEKYSDTPNVIYEICNEPNGINTKWEDNVKPYAESIVSVIRSKSPRALIIVGTPEWCKDLKNAADSPLNYENIAYACHFYAGSHGEELQKEINYCIEKNICVFVSECGITDASGAGEIYADKFKNWAQFLNEREISWVFWSFSNKDESSSILKPDYKPMQENNIELNTPEGENIENENIDENINSVSLDDYLTDTGKIIKSLLSK